MLTRRRLLQAAGTTLAMTALDSALRGAPAGGVDLQLGVQLWTVKDDLQRDYVGTLASKINVRSR
jgi:hypothetical protein